MKNDINRKSNWIETQQKQHTIYISMWICAYASELEVDIWAWRNTKKSLVCFVKVEFKKEKTFEENTSLNITNRNEQRTEN